MTIVLCKNASAAFVAGGLASYVCPSMVAVSFAGFGCQDARRIGSKVYSDGHTLRTSDFFPK